MNSKKSKSTIGVVLLIYIASMTIFNIITPDKIFSENENRVLEQRPKLSLRNVMEGKFTSNYENYISDQFPIRDFWIGVKSSCEKIIGKKENNNVYLGKDGYLLEKFYKPKTEELERKVEAINSFSIKIPDVDKYFMLVPNSVKILEEKLPSYAPAEDEFVYMDKVKEKLHNSIKFVDVRDILYSKKDEYIYYKTDHHWTTKGAYYGYTKLCSYMNIVPQNEDCFDINRVTDDFYGSLYSKSGFRNLDPDSIELYRSKTNTDYKVEYCEEGKRFNSLYNMDNLKKKDKYTVFFDGNHPLIKIQTEVSTERKLLIVRDSYANCFIPFLMEHFSEIYVVDLRYYNEDLKELIKTKEIDDMLILYNVKTFFEDSSVENINAD